MNLELLKYKFQKALAKGGLAMFLSLTSAFLICFFLIVIIRFLLVTFLPKGEDIFHDFGMHMWVTFLAMTDPGNMNQDNASHIPFKVTAIMSGLLGVVIFSTLIAFITTLLENNYYKLRKGRNKILESGHTLIIGWNEKVVDIIKELIYANESQKYASIVILAEEDKEMIEDIVIKNFPKTKSTHIYITTGDGGNLVELKRVNAKDAKSVIILSKYTESSTQEEKEFSDVHAIKTILALEACQEKASTIPIIVELFNSTKSDLIKLIDSERIISLDNWRIMGKLLLQTSLTSGLVRVYDEMLSFSGNEIYILPYHGNYMKFSELAFHYKKGIPLGIKTQNGEIILRPSTDTYISKSDKLIILSDDDSTIKQQASRLELKHNLPIHETKLKKKKKNILILGWHEIAFHYINESKGHLLEGSSFTLVYKNPTDEISSAMFALQSLHPEIKITLLNRNPFLFSELEILKPFEYDNVVILPQNTNDSSEKKDTDSLIILMMLRQIKSKLLPYVPHTSIIAQVLDSDNQDLIVQTEIDDFITSNKLITKIITQLSEQPGLKDLYEELFTNEGSEIYVKPLELYTKEPILKKFQFLDIMHIASQRNEICLGFCKAKYALDPTKNFGVVLNPSKTAKITLSKKDFLIVLAEDEL